MGLMGATGTQGPAGPQGPIGPQGPAGAGSGASSSSLLSAFIPGPLTQAYTAASFVPDSAITVTRISATLKTAPDSVCSSTVLRVTDGNSGQDFKLLGGQVGNDTGAISLLFNAAANLKIKVNSPASCSLTNPADANVLVEYRGQQSGDKEICAQSGQVCQGICEETLSDSNNCGTCGNVCPSVISPFCIVTQNCIPVQQACVNGVCGGSCGTGQSLCSGLCTNLQADPSNCGACGVACASGQTCASGVCTVSSGTGATCSSGIVCSCGPPQGTGGTGGSCAASCSSNVCSCSPPAGVTNGSGVGFCPVIQPCGAGLTACNSACVNAQTDMNNCGACGNVCAQGQACTGGTCQAACTLQHSNGLGQFYTDCSNPLGTPGNPATYTLTMAQEAAIALSTGTTQLVACSGGAPDTVTVANSNGSAYWTYAGSAAGFVSFVAKGLLIPPCPTTSSNTWN